MCLKETKKTVGGLGERGNQEAVYHHPLGHGMRRRL